MKSGKIVLLLLLIVQNSLGQFHKLFYKSAGFIVSHGASITHIALAGGGVVLKGVATPNSDSLSAFTAITLDEAKGISTIHIQSQGTTIFFSDSSWLMRDAAMLVKSEKKNEMHRDVNLFGNFSDKDYANGYNSLYPSDEFYNVEMADSLKNTKSGETLLLVDIMLASDENTKYYSNNFEAYQHYIDSKNSLENVIKNYNDSIEFYNDSVRYKSINDTYFKLKNYDSLIKSGKIDSSEITFLNKIQLYSLYYLFKSKVGYKFLNYHDTVNNWISKIDSLFKLDYSISFAKMIAWNDYTYNDENTNYKFYYTKYDKHLYINGAPIYTFLNTKHSYFEDEVKIDSLFTNFYTQHPNLIKNLNYGVVTNAEHFGQIAAFYRYLKIEYPNLWNQLYMHYLHIRKTKGQTPRFIGIYPSNEY